MCDWFGVLLDVSLLLLPELPLPLCAALSSIFVVVIP